jgi:hypothetical protein
LGPKSGGRAAIDKRALGRENGAGRSGSALVAWSKYVESLATGEEKCVEVVA